MIIVGILVRIKQINRESVQEYAEKLLSLIEDAHQRWYNSEHEQLWQIQKEIIKYVLWRFKIWLVQL